MTLSEIKKAIQGLSSSEREELFSSFEVSVESFINLEETRFSNGIYCPHCGTLESVQKFGFCNGKQRYRCKSCGRIFMSTTKSVLNKTHKEFSLWSKYIKCLLDGFSIRKVSKECSMSTRTAFLWRHKILDALSSILEKKTKLHGVIEADETYFRISYKGSRHLPNGYKSRKSGAKASKCGLSKELVCIPCAMDRHKNVISRVCNLGKTSTNDLLKFYEHKVEENSIFITDSEKSYKKFASQNNYKLIQIASGKHKKGIYHINHINAYHNNLKSFIRNFRGVSTKYLNNYIVWNNVLKMSISELMNTMMSAIYTLTNADISARKAIPIL